MGMNKKAMTFTIIAILFALTLVFFIVMKGRYSLSDRQQVALARVETMDNFINSMEVDINRALYISGFRAILSITDYLTERNTFLAQNDTEKFFYELMFQGTINGQTSSLMSGQTFDKWMQQIITKGQSINVNISFANQKISLYQENAWNVTVELNITMNINDTAQTASWLRNVNIKSYIPVENFEDPLYIIKGQKKVSNVINITRYENKYTNLVDDCTNLSRHAESSLYTNNSDAPSFLDRFEFDTSPWKYSGCCGIESFINALEFSNQGIGIDTSRSLIDHQYWFSGESADTNNCGTTLPSWFKISASHESRYQVP